MRESRHIGTDKLDTISDSLLYSLNSNNQNQQKTIWRYNR